MNELWVSPVKLLCVLLATTLISHGASSDPGKVAIDFLEKVRQGQLDLAPGGDTALSAQTADPKKREIAKRLERIAHDLGSDPLELGAVKMDEDFAAVLVRKVGGFDPSRLQVFPVALVKHGAEWTAAPLPASFENAGAGYAVALRKRLETLENWMLREQVLDLEKLRAQSADRMRQKIQASLTTAELRALDAKAASQRYLTACAKGDLPAILGLLGGLSTSLPDDWPARLKAADSAIAAGPQVKRPWRLITSPDVLRVLVHHEEEENSGLFSVACLDPSTSETTSALPRIEIVHFELSKSDDQLWRIDPPAEFLQEPEDGDEGHADDLDADLLNEFPAQWLLSHPAAPRTTAEQLHQAIVASLQGGDLSSLLQLTRLDGESATARKACILAAQTWWAVHDPTVVRHAMPLAFQESENTAIGLFQFFSARDPDKLDFKTLYFQKSKDGWLWTPEPDADTREKFKEPVATEIKRWSGGWQQQLLGDSFELTVIPGNAAPSKEDAQKVVEAWFQATRAGDVKAALRLTARLSDPHGGAAILRNLGHEMISARRSNVAPRIAGIYQGKTWTAVGMEINQAGKPSYPLYPVIQTPQGPRILIEIDLFASRGREFLNKTTLERLNKFGTPAAADDLRSLFADFQKQIESVEK